MGRVLAIGLDSGTRAVIEQKASAGSLPNLARFRGRAARHALESGPGHRHGILWPQFITGTVLVRFPRSEDVGVKGVDGL